MTGFKDHFSVAHGYARYRPGYPDELFDYLAGVAPGRDLAWDCGTGSGQAALGLATRFRNVVATDASLEQLGRTVVGGPRFTAALVESPPLASGVVDLVTVGQALHWFSLGPFYRQVRRVAAPGAVLAAWTYGLFSVTPEIDSLVRAFADETVGPYWPPERFWVDRGYAGLPFPFDPLPAPRLEMRDRWSLERVLGYLGTWSAVTRCRRETGVDPLPPFAERLERRWGGEERLRELVWELAVRVGRVEGEGAAD